MKNCILHWKNILFHFVFDRTSISVYSSPASDYNKFILQKVILLGQCSCYRIVSIFWCVLFCRFFVLHSENSVASVYSNIFLPVDYSTFNLQSVFPSGELFDFQVIIWLPEYYLTAQLSYFTSLGDSFNSQMYYFSSQMYYFTSDGLFRFLLREAAERSRGQWRWPVWVDVLCRRQCCTNTMTNFRFSPRKRFLFFI